MRDEIEHIIERMSPIELQMLLDRGMHLPERLLAKLNRQNEAELPCHRRREEIRLGTRRVVPGRRTHEGVAA